MVWLRRVFVMKQRVCDVCMHGATTPCPPLPLVIRGSTAALSHTLLMCVCVCVCVRALLLLPPSLLLSLALLLPSLSLLLPSLSLLLLSLLLLLPLLSLPPPQRGVVGVRLGN